MTVSYKEALHAVHEQRLEKEQSPHYGRPSVKIVMPAKDREELGALFHVWCDTYGVGHQDPNTGDVEYQIQTTSGTLMTHYDPYFGTIFGRFEGPGRVMFSDANPHTGKWNTHTSRGDNPRSIYDYWSRRLQSVLL